MATTRGPLRYVNRESAAVLDGGQRVRRRRR
jgi:hypothetical protein